LKKKLRMEQKHGKNQKKGKKKRDLDRGGKEGCYSFLIKEKNEAHHLFRARKKNGNGGGGKKKIAALQGKGGFRGKEGTGTPPLEERKGIEKSFNSVGKGLLFPKGGEL